MARSPGILSRRAALKLGAGAALPLVHIRTAGAAGKLRVAFTDNITPGADEALRKAVEQWAAQNRVEVQTDFLSTTTHQTTLTVAAEAQAKSGHDVVQVGYANADYAHLREPVDDILERLQHQYGPVNETVEYTGKVDGHWTAVPAYFQSNHHACVGRIDIFKQVVGIDLQAVFPAEAEMGPGYYDQWTWDAFLQAAERCAKAGVPLGLPISPCDDAEAWLGVLFRSYGAELVDADGNVAVNSDPVRTVLEYLKRLASFLPSDVYSWDNTSNNRALIAGRSALILNPPSAWAQAVKDQPQVGSQCWHFPPPAGPKGRFVNYFPQFWGIWSFSRNKSAAKELLEWLSQRERAEQICTAGHGFDIPPFLSMSDFKVWKNEGPPKGTLSNYPIKPEHHVKANLATYPAPLSMAPPIYNRAIMPNLVATVTQKGEPVKQAIAWAEQELQDLRH